MLSKAVWFWSLLVVLIPSFICLLFVLYHLLFDRTLRYGLNNHIIIVILIIDLITELTTYPWMIYFYHYNGVWERPFIFCEIWEFIDWGLYMTHTILFAWATIERHILIFHDRWISTKKKCFFVHYFSLIILLFYCLLFYTIVNFFPPCQNIYSNFYTICSDNCMYNIHIYAMYETIAHQIVPILVIVVFSIALILRVLWQKHRVRQPIQWRKYRKMTIQLLCISFLYLIFFLPYTLVVIINLCGVPFQVFSVFPQYIGFFSYFMLPLFPFVCALSLPELRNKFINILHLRRPTRRVVPGTLAMRTNVNRQIHNQ